MERLAELIIKMRWVLLLTILVITCLAALKVVRDIQFDFSPASLFLYDDPDRTYYDEFTEIFGEDDNLILIMFHRPGGDIFTPGFLSEFKKITRKIGKVKNIRRSLSLMNAPSLEAGDNSFTVEEFLSRIPTDREQLADYRQRALDNRIYTNQLISNDGKVLGLTVEFDYGFDDEAARRPVLDRIFSIIDEGIGRAQSAEKDLGHIEYYSAGMPVVQGEYGRIIREDLWTFLTITVLAIALLLLLVFRNAHGIYIPLLAVGFACLWTVALLVACGEKFNVLGNAIPTLLLTIGVADSIHILARYYEEIGRTTDKRQALIDTIKHIGVACLLTSLTTAIGFGSLYTARITMIKSFGLFTGIGVLLAFLVNITWMPAALYLHGAPQRGVKEKLDHGLLGRMMTACGRFTDHGKIYILLIGVAIFVFSFFGIRQVRVESHMMEELPHYNPIWVANNFAEENMSGIMPIEISIVGEAGSMKNPQVLAAVEKLQQQVELESDYVTKSISLVDLLKEMNMAFNDGDKAFYLIPESRELVAQYMLLYESSGDPEDIERLIDFNYSRMHISIVARDGGTTRFFEFKKKIDALTPELFAGTGVDEVRMTGHGLISNVAVDSLIRDLSTSIITAFLFIFAMMVILFRSLKLGAISMIPTVLPMLLTLGIIGFTGINIRISTVLIFSVSLGIAVDNTIHFIARFRSELACDGNYPAAVVRTSISTGRAIVFTSVILIFGFSVMGTSDFIALQHLAFLGGLTLLTALFASIFLLPVTLLIFKPIKVPTQNN
jgi:uncharacterized protein